MRVASTFHPQRHVCVVRANAGTRQVPAFITSTRFGCTLPFTLRRKNCFRPRSIAEPPVLVVSRATNGIPLVPGLPPEPVRFPRPSMDTRFAVLLLRSGYEVVDGLDFIPMDEFQVRFWKLRQREYEPYTLQNSTAVIRQGELADPLYFDFISFAQFQLISQEMPKGRQVFTESLGASGETRTVRRDATLADNGRLPAAFATRLGDQLYDSLYSGFQEKQFGAPAPCPGAEWDCVRAGLQRLAAVFQEQGFCITAEVLDTTAADAPANTKQLSVRMAGAATLWSAAALRARRALGNDYFAFAAAAFLRRSACPRSTYTSRVTATRIDTDWTIVLGSP